MGELPAQASLLGFFLIGIFLTTMVLDFVMKTGMMQNNHKHTSR
jgi:hypothetical protein